MHPRLDRVRALARGLGIRLAWIAVALFVALGGAGLAAAMNRVPGTAARPELTWDGDAAARPALAAAEASLRSLEEEVAALGSIGRLAIAELAANDQQAIDDAVASGTTQLARVEVALDAFRASLASVPGIARPDEAMRLSGEVRDRYDVLVATIRETDDLASDWRVLTRETLTAGRLSALLVEHDRVAGEAARAGSRADYGGALEALDEADARLAEATELADVLADRVEVTTLERWLDRNAAYDAALRELYSAFVESRGRVTDRVREAVAGERRARELLPEDTRALVVIMADVARGGLNQALISIEETRGALADALGALGGPTPEG